MDHFLEQPVKRKNQKLFSVLYVLMYILMGLSLCSAIYFFVQLSMDLENVLMNGGFIALALVFLAFAVSFGVFVLALMGRDNCKKDFEYSLTNGYFEIAAVMNNSKRKEIAGLKSQQILEIGMVDSPDYVKICGQKGKKKIKAWLNKDSPKVYIATTPLSGNKVITVEPSTEMLALLKQYFSKACKENLSVE